MWFGKFKPQCLLRPELSKGPMIETYSKIYWECFRYWLCAVGFIKRTVVCVRILKLDSLALQRNILAREGLTLLVFKPH